MCVIVRYTLSVSQLSKISITALTKRRHAASFGNNVAARAPPDFFDDTLKLVGHAQTPAMGRGECGALR